MSFSKTKIFNLSLSALLLAKEVSNTDTDTSNEVRILNTHWDIALWSTLEDLDLDSTSMTVALELLATLTDETFNYAYKYPSNCAFLRRIKSLQVTDTRYTHIAKKTGMYNSQKAIFTDEQSAFIEFIPKDISLDSLGAMTIMAIAYKLAFLSAPLITGKGAKALRESIVVAYEFAKSDAQEADARENFNYESDDQRSEFVAERLS
jgi:hypothetical protein